jgi:uncharacterized repeat protein (TIGR03803 family)
MMTTPSQLPSSILRSNLQSSWARGLLALTILAVQLATAQTLTVLHTFSGPDGLYPYSGVTLDRAGNLYGTTYGGGAYQQGTVYQLKLAGSSYIHNQLHAFTGGSDGEQPWGGVIFGPDGALYGTTNGGPFQGGGTVFSLRPPVTICRSVLCPWTETVLYGVGQFGGVEPAYGQIAFDSAGNIYGTTAFGGAEGYGDVYELSRAGNGWTGTQLYSFGDPDAQFPGHNVVLDSAGNLYGTTDYGGSNGEGTVFQLVRSGSGWSENILFGFGALEGAGGYPVAGLIMDRLGNFYGGTVGDGVSACVFELSPSGNGWQLTVLHSFAISGNAEGPFGNLVLDSNGNLYGTTRSLGTLGLGNIFKLSPSGGGWTYTDLYDFSNDGDGEYPLGDLTIDGSGNIYGTNLGESGHGVVWKLTP